MILAIDIGNTNISLGVFDREELMADWRLSTVRERTADELGVLIRQMFALAVIDASQVSAIIISSVVPPLRSSFAKMSQKYFNCQPIFVNHTTDFGMKIIYNQPANVGADRLVDTFAAREKYGKPLIVCDFGTATTIDVINENGDFAGGIITPGILTLADALFQKAAKLPKVEIIKPNSVLGDSTVGSIQAGIYFGYIGLVEGIIQQMFAESGEKYKVVATGGLAPLIAEGTKMIDIIDHNLMLDGLRLIHERQKSS